MKGLIVSYILQKHTVGNVDIQHNMLQQVGAAQCDTMPVLIGCVTQNTTHPVVCDCGCAFQNMQARLPGAICKHCAARNAIHNLVGAWPMAFGCNRGDCS